MKDKLKKYLLPNLPYLFFVYLFDKLCQAVRLAPGLDASEKLLHLRNRVLDVKTERQLARLQKNLSGDHPAIRRMYCRWGFAEDQGVTCYDILEAKLRRAHLTPYDPDGSEADYD